MHIRDEKEHLRQSIKERLERVNEREHAAESRSICKRILQSLPEGKQTICGFYSLKTEADIKPLLAELIAEGHLVYLPRFANNALAFAQVKNMYDLPAGALNIPEPPPDAPLLADDAAAIVLVPGRAFTKNGDRLGRGNGGYDLWIAARRAQAANIQCWGVALECQMVHTIPLEEHDQKMDAVVTARGMIKI
ncbi:MAG: 5-formyltetrahydrofolate cyclo-ligase [Candidatus Peribacteria bacterium]|nr:5-formyltetrahydrofolate cyclo-ligase [Candidatus Peribacteria bacterium]